MPPLFCIRLLAAIALVSGGSAALAETGDAEAGQVITLTPEQKEQALQSGSGRAVKGELPIWGAAGADRGIHGEVGAMIGTGGARGIYGTAAVPLGDNAGAIISFEKSRYGNGRGWIPVCADIRCRAGLIDPLP